MPAPTELFKGNALVLILSCLARSPMHGYRIVKELEKASEGYFAIREGTLYPHLHELERQDLIEGYWEVTPNGRKRRSYCITERGRRELSERLAKWEEFQRQVNRILQIGWQES